MNGRLLFCVVGEGTLPMQCADMLLQAGHAVVGVVSSDGAFLAWAAERSIPAGTPSDDVAAFVGQHSCDYLLGVVNQVAFAPALLALARHGGLVYYDTLLPRYAGPYATSWAIIRQEPTHGVTWARPTERADEWEVLRQATVEVAADETALSLNLKCYDAAIHSFAALLDDLAAGTVEPVRQRRDAATFGSACDQPSVACAISWTWSTQKIDSFVRALQMGAYYPNGLGVPKMLVGDELVLVTDVAVVSKGGDAQPGTVTALDDGCLGVAAADGVVEIRGVRSLDGRPSTVGEIAARHALAVGAHLAELGSASINRIAEVHSRLCPHEGFWVARLADMQPLLLPFAAPGGVEVDSAGEWVVEPLQCPDGLANLAEDGIRDAALAAFGVFLARVSGAASFDIGFCSLTVGNLVYGLDDIFAGYVPLRIDGDRSRPYAAIYQQMRERVAQGEAHLSYARDVVVRYPTLHALAAGEVPPCAASVCCVSPHREQVLPQAGGVVLLVDTAQGELAWGYTPGTVDPSYAAALRHQFETLLGGLVAAGMEAPAEMLPLLDEAERQRVLVEWNATEMDYPREVGVHTLVAQQVERTPAAVALVCGEQTLTYAALEQRANALAHTLRGLGVGPDVLVGLYVERSLEMVVGLLGILKAGGGYVPLDPAFPADRIALMLEDSEVQIVVSHAPVAHLVRAMVPQVVLVDMTEEPPADVAPPDSGATADNLAYVIYTSGSTGRPKGVQIIHRAVVNFLLTMQQEPGLSSEDVLLAVTTLSFDIAVLELLLPLITGARVVLASRDVAADGVLLAQALRSSAATVMQATPATWRMLLDSGWSGADNLVVLCGGEALPWDLAQQLLARCRALWNMYGPTETTIWSAVSQVRAEDGATFVGHPIANTQLYVLDEQRQPLPVGVAGELYIGGDGLARGYLHRPDLTAERFVPDPFSATPEARMYRTGDMVAYRPDGHLAFLGRVDHQVKIRGFRIELGEIEARLREYGGVNEVVVLAREDTPGDKRLVAYVQMRGAATLDAEALRAFLQQWLPEYMLPSVFVTIDQFPLTPNGKIDRRALPPPAVGRGGAGPNYVAPRSPVEERLAAIWGDVLGIEPVGVQDNFFVLGGHSLLATRVVARVRDVFGVDMPLRRLFEAPTVAGLSDYVETAHWAAQGAADADNGGHALREEGEI